MKRRYCPRCGDGKLSPARMAEDDVRRFCLSCSERTGRLVRRWPAGNANAAKQVQELHERAEAQLAERRARNETARKAKAVIYHQRGMCSASRGEMIVHICVLPKNHKGMHNSVPVTQLHEIKKKYGLA